MRNSQKLLNKEESILKKIIDVIYEGYRLAYYEGEFPNGLEVTSKHIARNVLETIIQELEITKAPNFLD